MLLVFEVKKEISNELAALLKGALSLKGVSQ